MTNRKNWLPSVSTCFSEQGSELYKEIAENDIHYVEFSYGNIEDFQRIDFVHNAKDFVKEMRSFDINPGSVHLPFSPFEKMDPTTPDIGLRDEIVRIQSEIIRAASDAGFPIAVIHPSGEPYRAFDRAERMECAVDALRKIAEVADSCGIRLCVENLPRTCLGNKYEEMLVLMNEIPSLFACFDTNHSLRQPNPEFIRKLGNKTIALHVSDYDMIDERHLLPFLGRNHWDEILSALEEVDYSGLFTFEVPSKGVLTIQNLKLAYNKLMEI